MTEEQTTQPVIELFVGSNVNEHGSIPVRWCISTELRDWIKERKIPNPHILLVVLRDKREMSRQIHPLGNMMAYVMFATPGKNTIHATVVWDKNPMNIWKKYMRKEDGCYATCLVLWDTGFELPSEKAFGYGQISVDVPKEAFAKKPFDWRWVNLLFDTEPRDQCQLRKRRVIAYTLQPLIVALNFIFVTASAWLAAGFLILCGYRGLDFKPLFHPFSYGPSEIWKYNYSMRNILRTRMVKVFGKDRLIFTWALMPIFYIILAMPTIILMVTIKSEMWSPYNTLLIYLGILAIGVFVCFSGIIFPGISRNMLGMRKPKKKAKPVPVTMSLRDLDLLACKKGIGASVESLPPEKRTVNLWFSGTKAKVCRPFAD